MDKLTDEQSKMVADNHSLIYWYCHKYNLSIVDWYDILAIELCYTVLNYKPEKGSLSGYFKLRADGVVYKECKKNMQRQNIEWEIPDDYPLTLVDNASDIIGVAEVNEVFSGENGRIIQLRYEGYTQSQIASILGTSQSVVSKTLKRIKEDFNID